MAKKILLTGASSGFGKLALSLLASRGHRVVAGIRGGETRARQIFGNTWEQWSGQVHALDLSLERPEQIPLAAQQALATLGGSIDVLINNAGYGLMGALEDQTPEQLRQQFEVNFFGPAELTRQLLPALRKSQGTILCVSSICGLATFPFYGAYTASKHALEAYFESLAYELKPWNVRVGIIEPGGFRTEFVSKSLVFGARSNQPDSPYYERTQKFRKATFEKQKFSGDPIEVARLIAELAESDRVPLRNLIGKDAWLVYGLKKILPLPVYSFLIERAFHHIFFR